MKIDFLISVLKQFISNNGNIIGHPKFEILSSSDSDNNTYLFDVKQFEKTDSWHSNGLDKYGVYFIIDDDDNILYIGKAEASSITQRIWSHIGTPVKQPQLKFPNNRFNEVAEIDDNVKNLIENGNFKVAGITVEPREFCSLIETFALTYVWHTEKKLPLLNKKIG